MPVNFWLVGQHNSQRQRSGRYAPASIRHPGKMLPELARRLIQSYTKPGEWILDPMSGIGTTGVEAMHLGRHYVGVELERRFVTWQRENLALARSQGAKGKGSVLQGDARRLGEEGQEFGNELAGPIGAILTSPPYGDRLKPRLTRPSRRLQDLIQQGTFRADIIPDGYGTSSDNLGNLSDDDYLAGMRQVYAGCYSVLKPGGIMAIVIRPGRDRQRLRPLHYETARLCLELGFDWIDEIIAITSRVETTDASVKVASRALFFKRLAIAHLREAGFPVTLEQLEYVLVFQKPTALVPLIRRRKNGLPAVLTGALPARIGSGPRSLLRSRGAFPSHTLNDRRWQCN